MPGWAATHFRQAQRLELPEKLLEVGVHMHACTPARLHACIPTYTHTYTQQDVIARGAAWGQNKPIL